MTNNVFSKNSNFWVFFTPLILLSIATFLSISSLVFYQKNSAIYSALIVDFTLTIPLVYFFLIRKKDIPKITVIPLFIIGMLLSSLLIPTEEKGLLIFIFNWIFPLVELFVLVKLGTTVYKLVKVLKETRHQNPDFYEAFVEASAQVFPAKIKHIVASEASLIYYCFFAWKNPKLLPNEFSYHRKTPIISMLYGFMLLIIAEGIGLHLWLDGYSNNLAWVFTFLSAYGLLQVFGILKSIPKRPIIIYEGEVHLKFGLLGNAIVKNSNIESIIYSTKDLPENSKGTKKLFLVEHNVLIQLKENQEISGLYGLKKDSKQIALFIDQPREFINLLQTQNEDVKL